MTTFHTNLGRYQSVITDPKPNAADVTLADAGHIRRAVHFRASSVNEEEVHLCHVLHLVREQFKDGGTIVVNDLVKIADWHSHTRLVAFALKQTRAIPGLTISFLTSNATQPAVLYHEFSQINVAPPPAYTVTLNTAAPTTINMGQEGVHVWKFVDNVDAYNGANGGALYIRFDAIPGGGISVPNTGGACNVQGLPVDIRFRITTDTYQF